MMELKTFLLVCGPSALLGPARFGGGDSAAWDRLWLERELEDDWGCDLLPGVSLWDRVLCVCSTWPSGPVLPGIVRRLGFIPLLGLILTQP